MNIPRPEYPRPQLVRDAWINLNGRWEFEFDPGQSGIQRGLPEATGLARDIVVPFCPESSLSGIGDVDFHLGVWYRREFALPSDWSQGRVLLHIGAADHDATVWVNGQQAGWHRGGFTPYSLDITPLLRRDRNVVTLYAHDDTRSALQAGGKQCPDYYSRRCHYTRTTGIWQTVWLELVPQTYIESLRVTPDLLNRQVLVEASLAGARTGGRLSLQACLGTEIVGQSIVRFDGGRAACALAIRDPQPWAPGSPVLYDLLINLDTPDGARDMVRSYMGLRDITWRGSAILLNGRPVFQRLVLDQGFYPDGIYTAPSDQALREDIRMAQAMGFNGARLHQKVFDPRTLYWADKLGYIVWGEFPNWGMNICKAEALEVFLPQWLEAVQRDYSHPSVVGWCPFNETQRDQDPEVLRNVFRATKALDHTRPVIDTSGYQHVETDIYDVHDYQQDTVAFAARYAPFAAGCEPFRNRPDLDAPYSGQPYLVSEYGGIWWNPGQADGAAWGYGGVEGRPVSEAEFLARFKGLTEVLLNHPRMCGFCYTQLTDVEQEVNGLYTYQRRAKFDPELIRRIVGQPAAIEK